MKKEKTFPVFWESQELYDLILDAIDEDNPYIKKETLLGLKEYFDQIGLMLYSTPPESIIVGIKQ